jgi:hypothetical protein
LECGDDTSGSVVSGSGTIGTFVSKIDVSGTEGDVSFGTFVFEQADIKRRSTIISVDINNTFLFFVFISQLLRHLISAQGAQRGTKEALSRAAKMSC